MTWQMFWYIFLFLLGAAIFDAIVYVCSEKFETSVFKRWNPRFWNRAVSSKEAPFLFRARFRKDASTIFTGGMIFCFVALAVGPRLPMHPLIAAIILLALFTVMANGIKRLLYKKGEQ